MTATPARRDLPAADGPPAPAWAVALGGLLALAVAMGIGRFAFTPLMPLMMRDGLVDADGGALLAAANYAGYLVGALTAARLPGPPLRLLRLCLPAVAALTAAAAWLPGLPAWLAWRFGAGVCSAWVLVATSSWALTELARLGRPRLAAWVYSGVGTGIASAGALAWWRADGGSSALWLALAALALALSALVLGLTRGAAAAAPASRRAGTEPLPAGCGALVFCYGSFGFGYILPATYLPALARALVDDPQRFGLAWPVFGLAAALSTLVAGRVLAHWRLLDVWAACHLAMAAGTAWPLFSRSGLAIAGSAVLVGGTFMVATMAGLQHARSLMPSQPTALLGRMTAAFALGQIAGPLVALALGRVRVAGLGGIDLTLALATALLLATGAWLWRGNAPTAPAAHA